MVSFVKSPIKRPALRYYGAKWRLAPWIVANFPPHANYVEPCGGSGAVLIQKPRSDLETFNDLDGSVVNFFKVLRSRADELVRAIRLTPWSRVEFQQSLEPTEDELERARRFWVWCWMGIGGKNSGWRTIRTSESRNGRRWPTDSLNIDHLYLIAERFQRVQIEHIDALKCVEKYDGPSTLIYLDPPYLPDTRERGNRYEHEWTVDQHSQAAATLRACAGLVIISGYATPLYSQLYESDGWQRIDRTAYVNGGVVALNVCGYRPVASKP